MQSPILALGSSKPSSVFKAPLLHLSSLQRCPCSSCSSQSSTLPALPPLITLLSWLHFETPPSPTSCSQHIHKLKSLTWVNHYPLCHKKTSKQTHFLFSILYLLWLASCLSLSLTIYFSRSFSTHSLMSAPTTASLRTLWFLSPVGLLGSYFPWPSVPSGLHFL